MTDKYHYRTCGLDNVFIQGLKPVVDDDGHDVYEIPHINNLHKLIASALIAKPSALGGQELRFLRTELGMTQSELAKLVNRQPLAISRWEREELEIEDNAEVIIRLFACERLSLDDSCMDVEELTKKVTPAASAVPILIDGSDPDNYRAIAA